MTARFAIPAYAAYGIELEYAIVDSASLDVRPYAERVVDSMRTRSSEFGWCHELAAHVVEVCNTEPSPSLDRLLPGFQAEVGVVHQALRRWDARLLPTAMHPWMNPRSETSLWTRSDADIYATYDRIFDCRSHGWSNIQSMHINLPFANDEQFRRLHAAIRIVLPLIPALAASSPVADAKPAPNRDQRLWAYVTNSLRYPMISGALIPDTVRSQASYERDVLQPMYAAIAEDDPSGVLRYEWLNSRGAIPRFDRSAIEIRLADTQEFPAADLAIAEATTFATRALHEERWSSLRAQEHFETQRLRAVLDATVRDAEEAEIEDRGYLELLGIHAPKVIAADAWRLILADASGEWLIPIRTIVDRGSLAHRIQNALSEDFRRDHLRAVYRRLCDCLAEGRAFEA